MQIKITVRFYFTPTRMATIKTQNLRGVGENAETEHYSWEGEMAQPLWKKPGSSSVT